MVIKDLRYIIKKIIIGVGIALILMLLRGKLLLQCKAQTGSLSSIVVYRGYTNGNYSDANNVRNQQLYGNLPYTIFAPYQDRTVWGIRLLADFSNIGAFNGSAYQNVLDVYFRFDQTGANDYWNNSINASAIYVSNLNTTSSVSCSLSSQTSSSRTYHCTGGFNNYEYPTTVNFVVGDPNNYTATSQWVSYINQYTSIDIGSITYSTTTAQSPDSANISDIKNGVNSANSTLNDIKNNQNSNTEKIINSSYVCKDYSYSTSAQLKNSYLNSNGVVVDSTNRGVSRYISINSSSKIVATSTTNDSYLHLCYFNSSKELISCVVENTLLRNQVLTVPQNSAYVRFSFGKTSPTFNICTNGSQALSDTLTDDNVDQSNADFETWFQNTHIDTHGLTTIITSPLRLVQGMLGTTCVPLTIPLPFVNQNVVLPCMTPIYTEYFNQWFVLYRFITDGVIAYWVAVNVFRKMQDFLDPNDDKVEVFDL